MSRIARLPTAQWGLLLVLVVTAMSCEEEAGMPKATSVSRVPVRTEHVVSPGLDLDVYVVAFDSRQGPLNAWVFASPSLPTFMRHGPPRKFSVEGETGS
jgi:hypothetical protein